MLHIFENLWLLVSISDNRPTLVGTKLMTIRPSTNLTRSADRHMSLTLLSLDMILPVSSQLFSSLGGRGGGGGLKILEPSVIKEMKAMMIWS
jgi:hypothetical protein